MSSTDVATFVARVRAERIAAGRPEHIEDPALYRLLDGILAARGTAPAETGTVQALHRSTTTPAGTGGRSD